MAEQPEAQVGELLFKAIIVDNEGADEDLKAKQKEMRDLLNTMIKQNPILLKDAFNRNIIFVGKTRSGKSTALNVMKNPFTFTRMTSIFSQTVDAKISNFTVEMKSSDGRDLNFNIGIIDTPGLFEVKEGGKERDNQELETIVLKCMNAEITKIHMIFFVVGYGNTGVNPHDIESLKKFIDLFDGAQKHVHILVTRAEKLSKSEKQKIEDEFRKFPGFSELLGQVNSKIYFLGAVENSDFEKGLVESFKMCLPNVLEMRQTLLLDIFQKQTYFELHALNMVDDVRRRAKSLFEKLNNQFKNPDSISDKSQFVIECNQLQGWLPLLDNNSYDAAQKLLQDCSKYFDSNKTQSS